MYKPLFDQLVVWQWDVGKGRADFEGNFAPNDGEKVKQQEEQTSIMLLRAISSQEESEERNEKQKWKGHRRQTKHTYIQYIYIIFKVHI